ncbi:phosphate acyltransferase PlsX [Oceanirhabdus sp. W0125-5]|uniref:phosphate acyltransferase PlsX n=1 Tax=Oceanirhabdus sp. W0125-5 TaxID=2999116 RepID=UPI0022F2ECED|nr:phosphate acyltransferase PlsX [Oceanirhabdus sp. W0125-5]WBW94802.1 phosphate acyltransferase PlsX [Oceanirhabdus sp. W0125-5]
MKIVVDGMGGDNSPSEIVKGCIDFLNESQKEVHIYITGPEKKIKEELEKYPNNNNITIVDASEVISCNEPPAMAVRKKKDSSMVKALRMVRDGEADAIISAGSTGALLTGATLIIGRIKGIKRAALAPLMPGKNGPFMLLDVGANVDCKPENLTQFALMGKAYFESVMNVSNPKVGLVNIGTEEEKGNELAKESYKLLKEENINFHGNVEPRDMVSGDVHVVVADGFVGNSILKAIEGVSSLILGRLKDGIYSSLKTKIGGALLKPVFKKFKKDFDYREYGGTPFLGVKGVCIKAHGSSDAKAIKNAIKQSVLFYDKKVIDKIKAEFQNN